jgi:anti-anti-sigma factor
MDRPHTGEDEDRMAWEDHQVSFRLWQMQGIPLVVASGEIDVATAPLFREALLAATAIADRVVLDLSRVTFLDSTGMGAIVRAAGTGSRGAPVRLALAGPTPMVRKVLEVAGLSAMLPMFTSVSEARAHLS